MNGHRQYQCVFKQIVLDHHIFSFPQVENAMMKPVEIQPIKLVQTPVHSHYTQQLVSTLPNDFQTTFAEVRELIAAEFSEDPFLATLTFCLDKMLSRRFYSNFTKQIRKVETKVDRIFNVYHVSDKVVKYLMQPDIGQQQWQDKVCHKVVSWMVDDFYKFKTKRGKLSNTQYLMISDENLCIGEVFVVLTFLYIFLSCEEDDHVNEHVLKHFQLNSARRIERPLIFE